MQTLGSNLLVVPVTVLTLLAFGAVLRRLLGVRVSAVRTLLGGLLALLVVAPLVRAVLPNPTETDTGTALLAMLLAVCSASLLAMVALVVAEVIIPEGSIPGPVEMWRGWRTRVDRTRRYSQILSIGLRHGLGRFLRGQRHPGVESVAARRRLARSLRQALDEGGVTFVKLGQQLSTRRDLLPPEFVEELALLQDQATPIPWAEVVAVLTAELGGPIDAVFQHIDPTPIAAASVAQVHQARLLDGSDVVVKVQRPGIAQVVDRDLDIVGRLAKTLDLRTQWGHALGTRNLAAAFADALREELDFTVERDNMRGVAACTDASDARAVRIPRPHARLCTPRVLVMERMAGVPVSSAQSVLAALSPERRAVIAGGLLQSMLDQVLVHGLFHVDVHPGNVLVSDAGSLALLDFGSVGRLDATTRTAIGTLLVALASADSAAASDALLELVDRPEEVNERELERAFGALIVRYASPGATTGVATFTALFRLVTSYRLGIPPPVAAVFRAFATLEGTLSVIDPGFDLIGQARELGARRVTAAMEPGQLQHTLEQELAALLPMLRRLPRRLDRIADAVEHGRLSMQVRLLAHPRDRRVVIDLLHQTLLAVLGAAAGLMAVSLLGISGGPQVTDEVPLFALLGYGLFIVAVVLVLRVLVIIFRRDSP